MWCLQCQMRDWTSISRWKQTEQEHQRKLSCWTSGAVLKFLKNILFHLFYWQLFVTFENLLRYWNKSSALPCFTEIKYFWSKRLKIPTFEMCLQSRKFYLKSSVAITNKAPGLPTLHFNFLQSFKFNGRK